MCKNLLLLVRCVCMYVPVCVFGRSFLLTSGTVKCCCCFGMCILYTQTRGWCIYCVDSTESVTRHFDTNMPFFESMDNIHSSAACLIYQSTPFVMHCPPCALPVTLKVLRFHEICSVKSPAAQPSCVACPGIYACEYACT